MDRCKICGKYIGSDEFQEGIAVETELAVYHNHCQTKEQPQLSNEEPSDE